MTAAATNHSANTAVQKSHSPSQLAGLARMSVMAIATQVFITGSWKSCL